MLCLHLSCLFLLSASLPVYLLCVVADCHGNVCLFIVCVHVCTYSICAHLGLCLSFCSTCVSSFIYFSFMHLTPSPQRGLYVLAHVHYTSTCTMRLCVCACDRWRPNGQGSKGWPVDTEPWQGSFLLPS